MVENYFRPPENKRDLFNRTQLHWAVSCGMLIEIERLKSTINIDDEASYGSPLFLRVNIIKLTQLKL
jgi:hypothetical protein